MKLALLTSEPEYIESIARTENLALVISNIPSAKIKFICASLNIPLKVIPHQSFINRIAHDSAIKSELDKISPDLIMAAGYNRLIVSQELLEQYKNKLINLHLSYLPDFPGAFPHEEAFNSKAKISGFTFHLIDKGIDTGRILFQQKINISDCKSKEEVKNRLRNASLDALHEFLKLEISSVINN